MLVKYLICVDLKFVLVFIVSVFVCLCDMFVVFIFVDLYRFFLS